MKYIYIYIHGINVNIAHNFNALNPNEKSLQINEKQISLA